MLSPELVALLEMMTASAKLATIFFESASTEAKEKSSTAVIEDWLEWRGNVKHFFQALIPK